MRNVLAARADLTWTKGLTPAAMPAAVAVLIASRRVMPRSWILRGMVVSSVEALLPFGPIAFLGRQRERLLALSFASNNWAAQLPLAASARCNEWRAHFCVNLV